MINSEVHSKSQNDLLYKVYGWMGLALSLTAGVAYYVASTPAAKMVFENTGLLLVLFLIQLGLVFALSMFLPKLSFISAALIFAAYSILNGITLSGIFLTYTQTSIASAFLVTAGMFICMALYGYFTKTDLSGMGSILTMCLIGLIIGMLVNMFLKSSSFDYIISATGVIVFSLLTAYDLQKIKLLSRSLLASGEDTLKISILGALTLYLDFINLFLFMLRFMGNRRQD